jgi:ribonuclease P protein component
VGFVVSRAVGGSVVRHTVTRRLRHLVRDRLSVLPAGCALVVRALPAAAAATSAELAVDLDAAIARALRSTRPDTTEPASAAVDR